MPSPDDTPCPECGQEGLALDTLFDVKPLGTWSLSGNQLKAPATATTIWRCMACGSTGPAVLDLPDTPGE